MPRRLFTAGLECAVCHGVIDVTVSTASSRADLRAQVAGAGWTIDSDGRPRCRLCSARYAVNGLLALAVALLGRRRAALPAALAALEAEGAYLLALAAEDD